MTSRARLGTTFGRRRFLQVSLVSLASGTAVLTVACGGDNDDDDDNGTGTGGDDNDDTGGGAVDTAPAGFSVVQRWVPTANTPGEVRLPFSIGDGAGLLLSGPDELEVRIVDFDTGDVLVEPFAVPIEKFDAETPPFWVANVTLDEPGVYRLQVLGGDPDGASVQVLTADQVIVPKPGEPLPPFDTPTLDDPRGVDPICSRLDGPCPFHDVTLTEALASGKPVVYLIGTPAHCQTGTCGPVLEELITASEQFGDDVVVVHADVYTDDTATQVAPAVQAYQMDYEPVLWVTDADGTIVARFDSVWAAREVLAALGLS